MLGDTSSDAANDLVRFPFRISQGATSLTVWQAGLRFWRKLAKMIFQQLPGVARTGKTPVCFSAREDLKPVLKMIVVGCTPRPSGS